jgi:outer membrane protein assembly factor BamB
MNHRRASIPFGIHRMRTLFVLAASALMAMAATAAESAVVMARGIVVDGEAGVAYIADGGGHTRAITLTTGAPRWRSDAVGLPLALANGRLLVLAGHIKDQRDRIVLLDPEDGAARGAIELDLPDGVRAVVTALPNRRFDVALTPTAQGLRLHWQYRDRALRGDLPDADATPAANLQSGAIDLDLGAARAANVAREHVPAFPRSMPNLQVSERVGNITLPQFRAADNVHVLASEPVADAQFGTAYRWNIHTRSDGARLGTVQSPHATAAFMVHEGTLIARVDPYAERRASGDLHYRNSRIAAFDLGNGQELWSHDVVEERFHGLMPP